MCLSLMTSKEERDKKRKQVADRNRVFLIEKVLEMPANTFPLITLETITQGSYYKGKQVKLGTAKGREISWLKA